MEELSAIAVLPFADMSPGRDQDYLCEGLAEELINALTEVEGLRVASQAASFQYRGAGADVREVGRALRVGTLLEGSVRKANNHLRVTVQLVEVSTGHHRWSQRFDRPHYNFRDGDRVSGFRIEHICVLEKAGQNLRVFDQDG